MSQKKIVVATDIIVDHVVGGQRPSVLRVAMREYFCYVTVFSAIELFARVRGERERRVAGDAMGALKILGLNPRTAPVYGELFRKFHDRPALDLLVAGLCIESGLPLLTGRKKSFNGIRGLSLAHPEDLARQR